MRHFTQSTQLPWDKPISWRGLTVHWKAFHNLICLWHIIAQEFHETYKIKFRNFPSDLSGKEEKAANPTLGKFTSSQFVPDHHFCILISPVIPSGGAPWYAIQSTVANGLKFFLFLPDCIAQTVKLFVLMFSVQEVMASCTVSESFRFMWLTVICTWTGLSG